MKRRVVLSPDALRQFRKLPAKERSVLRAAMREDLAAGDAIGETRNRFRLRRPSPHADFELRVQDLRVFYRVRGVEVQVALIGHKRGNALVIDGKVFTL